LPTAWGSHLKPRSIPPGPEIPVSPFGDKYCLGIVSRFQNTNIANSFNLRQTLCQASPFRDQSNNPRKK
jgi:hypothetical protein